MNRYQDIYHMARPVPDRPRMPRQNRAKIFAPYHALKGFSEALHAKDTVYMRRLELAEYAQERLDWKLRHLHRRDTVTVTWFQPKPGESGQDIGQYLTATGTVERVDPIFHTLLLAGERIPMDEIADLRGECLNDISEWRAAGEVPAAEETVC